MKKIIIDNIKTLFYALVIAIAIRSFFFQPFYIPSSSMEPTLLIGDRIFVSKFTYGFSKHSFPFSPSIYNERVFYTPPKRGDLVVFKTPQDNRTDYIKRLIGLPGDTIQFVKGDLMLNNKKLKKTKLEKSIKIRCKPYIYDATGYIETLPNNISFTTAYNKNGSFSDSDKYIVPADHFFLLGDNRDCSKDSRYLSGPGYVRKLNLVGKAQIIFFSNDTEKNSILKFWKWKESMRFERFFKKL
jgi:signal peptidase I